mmetsp:Transcript_8619/g.22522  ORF Transcript_8619/g.22522 Transcript_8619/m.22522 type:complete len:566 (-) Transcript_8619:296-1993(-)
MGQECSCAREKDPTYVGLPDDGMVPARQSNIEVSQVPKAKAHKPSYHSDVGTSRAAFSGGFVQELSMKALKGTYDIDTGMALGRGAYGSVTAVRRKTDGEQFALKMIKIGGESDATFEDIRNEVAIQKRLDHPNIAKIYECYEDVPHRVVYIVMECCTGGTLVSRMKKHRLGYGEKAAATIMHEMLGAVKYCHSHGVVHRDIKLDNMIFQGPEEDAELKLIDFGFANLVRPNRESMYEQLGTPSYMAPELWERDDTKSYNSAVDIWALGVCAYMLLSGTKPFYHKDLEQRRWLIRHKMLEFPDVEWKSVSDEGKDFCKQLLRKKADSRPSASEALNHPWLVKRSELGKGLDAAHELEKHHEVVAALESFAEAEDLKRLALEVVAFNSPPAKLEELRQLFHKMDTDNSGTISLQEFKGAMALHPELSERRLEQIFDQMDITQVGEVNYTEFLAATISSQRVGEMHRSNEMDAPAISTAFHKIDSDHDGYITKPDLQKAFSGQLNEEAMQRILTKIDSQTGRINFEQFRQVMLAENRRSDEMARALKKQAIAHQTAMDGQYGAGSCK